MCCNKTRPAPADCAYRILLVAMLTALRMNYEYDINHVCRIHNQIWKECFCVEHKEWSERKNSNYLRKWPKLLALLVLRGAQWNYFPGLGCSGNVIAYWLQRNNAGSVIWIRRHLETHGCCFCKQSKFKN